MAGKSAWQIKNAQHPNWDADIAFKLRISLGLRAARAPEAPRRLSSRFEGGCRIFRRHGDRCLDFGQAASRGSSQDCGRRGLLIRELTNGHPIMMAEGQIPTDELASDALE